jgi:hypothetical protein
MLRTVPVNVHSSILQRLPEPNDSEPLERFQDPKRELEIGKKENGLTNSVAEKRPWKVSLTSSMCSNYPHSTHESRWRALILLDP